MKLVTRGRRQLSYAFFPHLARRVGTLKGPVFWFYDRRPRYLAPRRTMRLSRSA